MLNADIINILEKYAPSCLAESWDNPGMQTGDLNQEIKSLMVALDATDSVIGQAVDLGVDLLVTHHPILFRPIRKITEEDFIGRRLRKLIRNNISLYAMHTNCDIAKMADCSGIMLGLTDAVPLGQSIDMPREMPMTEGMSGSNEMGIGKAGNLKEELTFEELCRYVKKKFNLDYIEASGERDALIKRVAICPGSGHDYVEDAISKKAQVLITGDLGHHAALDARAKGLFLIDAGHFGTEAFMKQQLAGFLKQNDEIIKDNIHILLAEEENPFFIVR